MFSNTVLNMILFQFFFSEAKSACTKAGIINFQDKYLQRNFGNYKADKVYSLVERLRYAKVLNVTVVFSVVISFF